MAALGSMYKINPCYEVRGNVMLSDVMYRVGRLYQSPNVDSQQTDAPLSLEERQENLLKKLDSLISVASARLGEPVKGTASSESAIEEFLNPNGCPCDIVIRADPSNPPRWLGVVKKQLEDKGVATWWKFHSHSSVTSPPSSESFPRHVRHQNRHCYKVIVTVIWTTAGSCPSLHINPSQRTPVCGESNIFRFFARLLGMYSTSLENDAMIDVCLDSCDVLLTSQSSQEKASSLKSIGNALECGSRLSAGVSTLLAAFLASVLVGFGLQNVPQESLRKWAIENSSLLAFS